MRQGWTGDEKERAAALFDAGRTCAEIGAILDRSRKSVHTMLVRRRDGEVNSRIITPWSKDDIALLESMRAAGKGSQEIADALGRHITHVYSKSRYVETRVPHHTAAGRVDIPPDTEREWRRRLAISPHTLTAAFCGDPPPGYSALDRRRA